MGIFDPKKVQATDNKDVPGGKVRVMLKTLIDPEVMCAIQGCRELATTRAMDLDCKLTADYCDRHLGIALVSGGWRVVETDETSPFLSKGGQPSE